ncbi:MAG: ABC transporter ATP-binding protein [Atopobium sp.]|uniref:ABC transporter ATP-binding protein n=1 Tax=Atopobium sp. TaxID=1872650 RepID=UPI002A7EF545|nr:ABC transporter ATP-binding protein [Atopobium sp.]MDY4522344.1 ABC transporter ATP-binding protein [Atopobium sp.]
MSNKKTPTAPGATHTHKTPQKSSFIRVITMLFEFYPVHTTIVLLCIVISAIASAMPSVFMQQAIAVVTKYFTSGNWEAAQPEIAKIAGTLLAVYTVALIAVSVQVQTLATLTQGTLMNIRNKMFDHMEDLPIRFFDTNKHGDIMSYYTNDVDALRQLISQSLPSIITAVIGVTTVLFIMLWYSIPLTLIVLAIIALMMLVVKTLGTRSARFFITQQKSLAQVEGFAQEAMAGQKVIKVFTHEQATQADFDKVNEELYQASKSANIFANMLMPILFNLGNLAYALVALAGGFFIINGLPSPSLSGAVLTIDIAVSFLTLTKNLTSSIGQVSGQINSIVMGLAGAARILDLLDQEIEEDEGYVTLVNVSKNEKGELVECPERTDIWAWKHPHHDGTLTYTPLAGDIVLDHVDFGYSPEHTVLHDVSLYAKPGQKVAFVGATGAGKTTITNLINRFYDIADGRIRYDGININKIKKADLRRSLGMVLQDTNLFTGTVMDNIRYGRLDASDDECIGAAKLAGADSFIRRLPDGYNTMLTDNATQLSQGQRQLLTIARAAVADPPAMILDEATSSIDTRTEFIVQRGMDALMAGRTTFVIAHRLSTVRNSDVIIVLDHGHIIERGTHDNLIAAHGTYYQLYTGAFELE